MQKTTTTLSLAPLVTQWQAANTKRTKYLRLAEALSACIHAGDYRPGDQLPKETEICDALPVGLSTVQKALGQLVEKGLIVRRRKLGSFITDARHQVPEVHVYRFHDPATGELMMPYTRVVGVQRVSTSQYGALLTGFDCEEVMRVDRLVWVTGSPPAFSAFFMRPEVAVELPDSSEVQHGASYHRLLWERFGIRTASVRHSVTTELLSRQACEHLDLAAPHVGMLWDAFEYDSEDRLQLVQRFELPRGHRPMELVETKP
ncbi:GntR family transcriptional regulator [Halomonas sp. S2151]|uniref:GntR family transcriptional regulator n=1 Tax=Halomonas sp. S2151 TaxID=579478 RepID=UPI0005FA76F4|nr:GntR family transcriptional regulator [Halomonas sp. S2151]KJZ09420.1 GntR family transcriptional regulator [Halomonas sp. S2151]